MNRDLHTWMYRCSLCKIVFMVQEGETEELVNKGCPICGKHQSPRSSSIELISAIETPRLTGVK